MFVGVVECCTFDCVLNTSLPISVLIWITTAIARNAKSTKRRALLEAVKSSNMIWYHSEVERTSTLAAFRTIYPHLLHKMHKTLTRSLVQMTDDEGHYQRLMHQTYSGFEVLIH